MAFGDSPDDESLRKAWIEFCRPIAGGRRARVQGLQPADTAPPRGRLPLPDAEPRAGLRSRARDEGHALSGDPRVLHAASQARRRCGRLHLSAGVDRRRVHLQDLRQSRHGALSQLHGARAAPGENARDRMRRACTSPLATSPRPISSGISSRPHGTAASSSTSVGRGADRTGCRRRPARASSSSARASTAGTSCPRDLRIERIGMDGAAPVADARDDRERDRLGGRFVSGLMDDWPDHPYRYSGGVDRSDPSECLPAEPARRDGCGPTSAAARPPTCAGSSPPTRR